MIAIAQLLNLGVRFAVELALLAAITAAAWQVPPTPELRYPAAVGALLTVSIVWVFVVHNDGLATPIRLGAQVAAFAVGIGCLLWLHSAQAAAALTVIALLNAALLAAWNQ